MERQPVVAIVGHVDHGKSTLLDAIRKSKIAGQEAGGITQRIGAYEVVHKTAEGVERRISFIDTPGHEAFGASRACAADAADVAILAVAGDDGAKPQTLECARILIKTKTPFVVALTKADKPNANLERAKQSLAEHEIFVEGYGGSVPCAAVSAKTGAGVAELLDLVLLLASLGEKSCVHDALAHGIVLEAERSKTKGITATLIVQDGTLRKGQVIAAGGALSVIRMLEDFAGKPFTGAGCGRVARVYGWDALPKAGATFRAYETREAAREAREQMPQPVRALTRAASTNAGRIVIPLVVKADTDGSLDAVEREIEKVRNEKVSVRVVSAGLGSIGESDLRAAENAPGTLIVGFNVAADVPAERYMKATGTPLHLFDIIYRLSDFLADAVRERTPKEVREEVAAQARILKIFSEEKKAQIIGGKVLVGTLASGNEFRILRRGARIGEGKIKELQRLREKVREASEGTDFGASVAPSLSLAVSDIIEVVTMVEV